MKTWYERMAPVLTWNSAVTIEAPVLTWSGAVTIVPVQTATGAWAWMEIRATWPTPLDTPAQVMR